jgi:hypothetical protein
MHARAPALGVIDAFAWIEQRGDEVLTVEERKWAREAEQRRGCKYMQDKLSHEDRMRVIALGRRCMETEKSS